MVCKHFLRLADDAGAVLAELAHVTRPGGRAYVVDFDAERPWLAANLLHLWILLTAPAFIRRRFAASTATGPPGSTLPDRLTAAGFEHAAVIRRGVSYLVRATR